MGFLKKIGVVAIILLVVAVLVLGATGFVPGVSDIMGTSKPRDLGVKYSDADYQSALAKFPGHSVKNAEDLCITCPMISRGSVPVDTALSQEEFTANLNKINSKKGPVKDIQVKFNSDGAVETSALVIDPRITAPVYAKGKVMVNSARSVSFDLDQAEAGRVGISGEQLQQVEDVLNEQAQVFLSQNPGLSIESLSVQGGKVNFKGTYPAEIEGIPSSVPRQLG